MARSRFCDNKPALSDPLPPRSEEHTSELQSRLHLVCRLLLEKKKVHYHAGHECPPHVQKLDDRLQLGVVPFQGVEPNPRLIPDYQRDPFLYLQKLVHKEEEGL